MGAGRVAASSHQRPDKQMLCREASRGLHSQLFSPRELVSAPHPLQLPWGLPGVSPSFPVSSYVPLTLGGRDQFPE